MYYKKNYIKLLGVIFILVMVSVVSACKNDVEDNTETNITPMEQQHTDSLVKSDKERADSMLNAFKEKLK